MLNIVFRVQSKCSGQFHYCKNRITNVTGVLLLLLLVMVELILGVEP